MSTIYFLKLKICNESVYYTDTINGELHYSKSICDAMIICNLIPACDKKDYLQKKFKFEVEIVEYKLN